MIFFRVDEREKIPFWFDRILTCFQSPLHYSKNARQKMFKQLGNNSDLKKNLHPVYLKFGPALSDKSLPGQLREKEPLRKMGFCPARSQDKSTHPQNSLHCLPFHRGLYSWPPPAQVRPFHLLCKDKNPKTLPTVFLWIEWLKWCPGVMAE